MSGRHRRPLGHSAIQDRRDNRTRPLHLPGCSRIGCRIPRRIKKLNAQRPKEQALSEEVDAALVRGVDFGSDGKCVVTNHSDGSLRVWNAATGTQVAVAKAEIEDNLAIRPGDLRFATVFGDKIAIRSLTTAAVEQELKPPKASYTNATPFAWSNGRFSPLRFSPDGQLLVQASVSQNRLIVWDLASKTAVNTSQTAIPVSIALASSDHRYLYTIAGQIAKSWNLGASAETVEAPEGIVMGVSMSRDRNWLAWNGGNNIDVFSSIPTVPTHYSLPSCHNQTSLVACDHQYEGLVEIMGFSDDDSLLFFRETVNFLGSLYTGTATEFYAAGMRDKSLKPLFTLPLAGAVTDAFCPERNLIAFVQPPSVAQLSSGVTASPSRTIRLFDVTQSKEIEGLHFAAATDELIEELVSQTHEDNPENFPDLAKARIGGEKGLRDGEAVTKIVFSPAGKFLAATYQFHGVALWRMADGKFILHTGPHIRPDGKPGSMPTAIAFSPDNRWLIAGWDDGTIRRFDTNTGREAASWAGHGNSVTSLSFVSGSDLLISTGEDGTVKFWNLGGGSQPLLTLSPGVNPYDWAAVSSAGLFDGGSDGWSRFLWRFHNSIFDTQPVELFFREYFHPDLLVDFFNCAYAPVSNCGRVEPARPLMSINRTLPIVDSISIQGDAHSAATVSVSVNLHVPKPNNRAAESSPENRVYDVRLFRDGQLVAQYPDAPRGAAEQQTSITTDRDLAAWRREHAVKLDANGRATIRFKNIRLPQRPGVESVKFTAYAFNSDRVKSLTARPVEFRFRPATANASRTAFLITMGVNANESPHLNFDLAVSSAEDTRALLKAKLQEDYQEVVEIPLYSELEPDSNQVRSKLAQKADLEAVLDSLAGRSADGVRRNEVDPKHQLRAAGPDDAVIVYIASHGYVAPDGTFYLMPYDTGSNWGVTEDLLTRCESKPDQSTLCGYAFDFLAHSVSSSELAAWWHGVDAGTMVMILDSCHSGAVAGRQFRPAPLGDPGFGQLAYDKGMLIVSASQPAQTEKGQWVAGGQGLTLLVDALETAAKANPDKSFLEWLHETKQQLPLLTSQLYPAMKEADIQIPVLLDFTNETRLAALAAADPLGNP